jgi:hypothetical protein
MLPNETLHMQMHMFQYSVWCSILLFLKYSGKSSKSLPDPLQTAGKVQG